MSPLQEEHINPNATVVRRNRLLVLLQSFVQEQAAIGMPPKGLEQAFAAKLQISPSLLSQIKKSRPIGDKLARQVETACGKPAQWLDACDEQSPAPVPSPAEELFVELARAAWRQANAKGKRDLMKNFKDLAVMP